MSELRQRIQDVIENEPVALFMKGTPQFVMCGNSGRATRRRRRGRSSSRRPPEQDADGHAATTMTAWPSTVSNRC